MSERERQTQLESTFRDVATTVTDMCVNPDTKRPYTVGVVERAMKDVHYSVKPHKNTKQQALEVIQLLKPTMQIERARMRLKVTLSSREARRVRDKINPLITTEQEEWESDLVIVSGSITNQTMCDMSDLQPWAHHPAVPTPLVNFTILQQSVSLLFILTQTNDIFCSVGVFN